MSAGRGLRLMRPDGSDRRFVDPGPLVGIGAMAWSPDGRQLAVETYDNGGTGADPRVLLLAADGSSAIAIESAGAPVWSPDGRFVAVSNSSGSHEDVLNADGTGRTHLPVAPTAVAAFAWIR